MTLTLHDLLTRGPGALRRRVLATPHALRIALARRGTSRHCAACGASFGAFLPHRKGLASLSTFLRRSGYVTGDFVNHQCPVCWSHDRERHLLLYFDALRLWDLVPEARVLHFAPESEMRRRILALGPARYVAADLTPADPDTVAMDVMAIPEQEASFDLVICNHVLEHVGSVETALSELARVLKPGGTAVLQTPFASRLSSTLEDPMIETDEDRLFFYGQEDHARLFGLDVFDKMRGAGLDVRHVGHPEALGGVDARREGVSTEEGLFLARKPVTPPV